MPEELGESEPRLSTFVLSAMTGWHIISISDYSKWIVKMSKAGNLVPHEISAINLSKSVSSCIYLSSVQQTEIFLKLICTGDERGVLYVIFELKRKWFNKVQKAILTEKPGLHSNTVLLCVWRDWLGFIHLDFLKHNQTITTDIYSQKLNNFQWALFSKQPSPINR